MTPGQRQALNQLRAIENEQPGAIEVLGISDTDTRIRVEISIDCRGTEHADGGVRLRARERFFVSVPVNFPFRAPSVEVPHKRWRTTPHVQWGSVLCTYQSVETEWNPAHGMYGYLERLLNWLTAASLGELDPIGAPLHPPVTYTAPNTPMFVPRVNTPRRSGSTWVGFAILEPHGEHRRDIVAWEEIGDVGERTPVAAAFLLDDPMPFEFPSSLLSLLHALLERDVPPFLLFTAMNLTALINGDEDHVYVVVGSPMRGIAGEDPAQHLTVWRLSKDGVDAFAWTRHREGDSDQIKTQRSAEFDRLLKWSSTVRVEWCSVREARPEVTRPRDEGSSLNYWSGKKVAVWGCGALGSHVAEHLARSGVASMVLRDVSSVGPGILVRQNFEDEDIGHNKASALANRIRRISPSPDVTTITANLIDDPGEAWDDEADVVLDLTASPAVGERMEFLRRQFPKPSTTLVAMTVGHDAKHGLVATSPPNASGGPMDCRRKAKIAASRKPALRDFANEFWPLELRADMFQPEPGCSDPTFRGSDAEVAALAATMLLVASNAIDAGLDSMTAGYVALPSLEGSGRTVRVDFPNDLVLEDPIDDYEVRVSEEALAEIRGWMQESVRMRPRFETGGILFGERDEATRVIWVTDVIGPPPGSIVLPVGFVCGTEGVTDTAAAIQYRSRDACRPIGMWHTHPDSDPVPSLTDGSGMDQIVSDIGTPMPWHLLLIVGGTPDNETIGAYVYSRHNTNEVPDDPPTRPLPPPLDRGHKIGLALSGGGFRAVAFHLGVLRALHDRGVLDKVEVVSSVSGGSIIAALWAYGPSDFLEFDRQVTDLLRRGLTRRIAHAALLSRRAPQALGTAVIASLGKIATTATNALRRIARQSPGRTRQTANEPRFRRWVSRTTALHDVLAELFDDATLDNPTKDVHVIINACDLRTGSAFRFGSVETGCTRYGKLINNDVPLALAVAASAAYPMLLPALDVRWDFLAPDGSTSTERVLLTDGGVYDNLGTSCLLPDRDPAHSTNVHPVDYVISADAGRGVLDADTYPLWWPSRAKRSFESVYRKVQDGGKADLFQHAARGTLQGLVMPFLGQNDSVLPIRPTDLVPRDAVIDYPTDFSPMSERDLHLITTRGEQLARLVIEHHSPEIA